MRLFIALTLLLSGGPHWLPVIFTAPAETNILGVMTDTSFHRGVLYSSVLDGRVFAGSKHVLSVPVSVTGADRGLLGLVVTDSGVFACSVDDSGHKVFRNGAELWRSAFHTVFTHAGCGMDIDGDYIYIATGDGAKVEDMASAMQAQDDSSQLGKVLKININTGAHEVVGKGLRNPFKLKRHGGETYIADVGMFTVERIVKGEGNFGWPCYEGSRKNLPCEADHIKSIAEYGHNSIGSGAITGLSVNGNGIYYADINGAVCRVGGDCARVPGDIVDIEITPSGALYIARINPDLTSTVYDSRYPALGRSGYRDVEVYCWMGTCVVLEAATCTVGAAHDDHVHPLLVTTERAFNIPRGHTHGKLVISCKA